MMKHIIINKWKGDTESMKIKGRTQVPSGRQYEVLEISYEITPKPEMEKETHEWIKTRIKEDAKELFHCLKEVKEHKEGDYVYMGGQIWRLIDGKWEYKDQESGEWKS